ncbi:hypothetical protein OF83DRAFT_1056585, partial [Amylostereum chailletii]
VRIGADSEDHTNFNPSVQVPQTVFPAITATVPYPEASTIVVGNAFYEAASHLPAGTQVIWGVNLRSVNLTAAHLEATAIAHAFASSALADAGVALQAIEIGNEADLYGNGWTIEEYVGNWTVFANNVTAAANAIMGEEVALMGCAFAGSSHSTGSFSPQGALDHGLLDSPAGSQIDLISQHHYSGSFCTGSESILQDLMSKTGIRGNLSAFAPDIAAVHDQGLTYVLGETNSYSCHGAPGVSNTAGAALWGLDYALFATQLGIARLYFHEGVGYKYNFVQPVTLTRSILDGSPLAAPLPPHVQPLYYAAIVAAEAIGASGTTSVVELAVDNDHVTGYAFFEDGALARALFVNLRVFDGGARGAVHVGIEGVECIMVVKRLSVPTANATEGLTWGGQTYETEDAMVQGGLQTQTVDVSVGVDVHDTEVVMLSFQ